MARKTKQRYGSISELLDDFDFDKLNEPFGFGEMPNDEQRRFVGTLNERYGLHDNELCVYGGMYRLLQGVTAELSGSYGDDPPMMHRWVRSGYVTYKPNSMRLQHEFVCSRCRRSVDADPQKGPELIWGCSDEEEQ